MHELARADQSDNWRVRCAVAHSGALILRVLRGWKETHPAALNIERIGRIATSMFEVDFCVALCEEPIKKICF